MALVPGGVRVLRRAGGDTAVAEWQARNAEPRTLVVRQAGHFRGRGIACCLLVTPEPEGVDVRTRRPDGIEELGPQVRVFDGVVLFDESEGAVVRIRAGRCSWQCPLGSEGVYRE